MDRFFCAAAAVDRDDPVTGTASRVDRWLLVEASGPWGARSLPQNRGVGDETLLGLQRAARAAGVRPLLVRRPPGRPAGPAGGRRLLAADSRPGREQMLTRVVPDDAELADIPLPFEGDASGWLPTERVIAVCTHGGHDPCCAVWGRPVVEALSAAYPDATWEVSHIGGDRFAGNVLILPEGHYLGRVPPDRAAEVVQRLLAGERPAPHYRGRSCWPMPAQAAVELTAELLGEPRLDGLVPVSVRRDGEDRWRVRLARPATTDQVEVVVVRRLRPERVRLTCRAGDSQRVAVWELAGAPSATG